MALILSRTAPIGRMVAAGLTGMSSIGASAGAGFLALANGHGGREVVYQATGAGLLALASGVVIFGGLYAAGVVVMEQIRLEDTRALNLMRQASGFALDGFTPIPEPEPRPEPDRNGIIVDGAGNAVKLMRRGKQPKRAYDSEMIVGRAAINQAPEPGAVDVRLMDVSRGAWIVAQTMPTKEGKWSEEAWTPDPFSIDEWRVLRGRLIQWQYLRWKNERAHNQGLLITPQGRAAFRALAGANTPPPAVRVPLEGSK